MDARSCCHSFNQGYLTSAEHMDINYKNPKYYFDSKIYDNRVYNGYGKAD